MAASVDSKLLKSTKFPLEFSQKVDMQKVNVEVMKKYYLRFESPFKVDRSHNFADGSLGKFPTYLAMKMMW